MSARVLRPWDFGPTMMRFYDSKTNKPTSMLHEDKSDTIEIEGVSYHEFTEDSPVKRLLKTIFFSFCG